MRRTHFEYIFELVGAIVRALGLGICVAVAIEIFDFSSSGRIAIVCILFIMC